MTSVICVDDERTRDHVNWLFVYVLDELQVELDEPTSGVDPGLARTLRTLTDEESAASGCGYLDLRPWPAEHLRVLLVLLERVRVRKTGEWKPTTLDWFDELVDMLRARVAALPP
jgi:hypothetical protein